MPVDLLDAVYGCLIAGAILYLCQGDPNRCVVEGANFGRDADSIANLAGSLVGALRAERDRSRARAALLDEMLA